MRSGHPLKRNLLILNVVLIQIWHTGNHDVRILATMVAKPEDMDETMLDTWVKDLDNYVISDLFSTMVSKTPFMQKKM